MCHGLVGFSCEQQLLACYLKGLPLLYLFKLKIFLWKIILSYVCSNVYVTYAKLDYLRGTLPVSLT